MLTVLHFADAHIDIATQGKHDPASGLPLRAMDFLKALDVIIDTALQERVDLVLFAGDAYKDRTPSPTFQREWGRRIMRLSEAGIPTLLLVGNHDLSPAIGRANALHEFDTLQVPHVRVVGRPEFIRKGELDGLPLQILALPWITRSGLMAARGTGEEGATPVDRELIEGLDGLLQGWLAELDDGVPAILAAHASVEGAVYGGERSVMLGGDINLPGRFVRDPRLDYVALGHIHKHQNLNPQNNPPAVYPGSIERVDFGEAADEKGFVIARVERGSTTWEWRRLDGRRFIDRALTLSGEDAFMEKVFAALPSEEELAGAIVRLVLTYPRPLEPMLDEPALRRRMEGAFEFHLQRRPQTEVRLRLAGDQLITSIGPLELLDQYWKIINIPAGDAGHLQELARLVIEGTREAEPPAVGDE